METAPEYYVPFDIVTPPMVGVIDHGGWDIVLGFDCTDVSTQGFAGKMWRRVRIEVTEPGLYGAGSSWIARMSARVKG